MEVRACMIAVNAGYSRGPSKLESAMASNIGNPEPQTSVDRSPLAVVFVVVLGGRMVTGVLLLGCGSGGGFVVVVSVVAFVAVEVEGGGGMGGL